MRRFLLLALVPFVLAASSCQTHPTLTASGPEFVTVSQLKLARQHLKEAARATDRAQKASHALVAAEIAWDLNWKTSQTRICYAGDQAAAVYEDAVLLLIELSDEAPPAGARGRTFRIPGPRGTYLLTVDPRTYEALRDYPLLHPASDYSGRGGFKTRHLRPGVGAPLVGENKSGMLEWLANKQADIFKRSGGYCAPRTALLLFDKPVPLGGERRVKFAIVDPRQVKEEPIGSRVLPVAADFTAPLMATYPRFGNNLAAIKAAIWPDAWLGSSRIYALEVYDPKRIPVLLVHGLFSTPDMWKDVINDLSATPGIGDRFQFYVFTYPTGLAPSYTASLLREKIERAEKLGRVPHGYVLIGHSMGGILSRLQATDSGRVIWDQSFGAQAAKAWKHSDPDDLIRKCLVTKADPHVRRMIFLCVPHRGSPVADLTPVRFLARLAGAPLQLTEQLAGSPLRALGVIPERLPSSANGLSPESPTLLALDKLPMKAPCHSVVGDRGRQGPLEKSSDGIVPYWSSHQQSALSEVVVPAGHGGFDHPLAIEEMKRILLHDATRPDPGKGK